MQADEKQRILDTLLGSETAPEIPPDAEQLVRARRLIVESGAANLRAPDAAVIWRSHKAHLAESAPKEKSRILAFPGRWLLPALGAVAAAAAVFIWMPRSQPNPAPGVQQTGQFNANYRDAADVYVKQVVNYRASAEGDTLHISADAIEARIDFRANATTRTVEITTPSVVYRIIGTSIAIAATPERSMLHVAEGKVQVTTAGKTQLVVHGEVWTTDGRGEQKRAQTSADKEFYQQLAGGKDVPLGSLKEKKGDTIPSAGHPRSPEKSAEHKADAGQENSAADNGNRLGRERNTPQHREREAGRSDRAAARAEREARRSEREARRSERQATKAERHK